MIHEMVFNLSLLTIFFYLSLTEAMALESTPKTNPKQIISTWEPQLIKTLEPKIQEHFKENRGKVPFLLAIAGIPGSGKTTSSSILSSVLSNQYGVHNVVLPMDGYHYPLSYLKALENSADMVYRRGASDTFDAAAFQHDLKRIRDGDGESIIFLPGFDHAVGDPEKGQYKFERSRHDVVICEGLYLFYDEGEWKQTKNLFHYKIFIDADIDRCIDELKERNKCIPGYTPEEIEKRCDEVDRQNALTVVHSRSSADEFVTSANVLKKN